MPTLEQNIRQAVHEVLLRGDDPSTVAAYLASIVNEIAGRRLLQVRADRVTVFTPAEITMLECAQADKWMSAKAAWLAVRPGEPYAHGVSVLLGKQLALRYAKQRKQGPTRLYWIATPTIETPKA